MVTPKALASLRPAAKRQHGIKGTEERAQRSLDILLAQAGSTQGFLYAVTSDGDAAARTGLGLVVGDPDVPFRNMTQLATQLSRYAGLGR